MKKTKKVLSAVLAAAVIASGFTGVVLAQEENDIALIAQWDMKNHTMVGNEYKVADSSGNNIVLNIDHNNDNKASFVKIGNSIYSDDYSMKHTYPSNYAQQYNSEDNTYSNYPEKLFEAFDTKYTFETWFRMDEMVPVLGGIYEVTSEGNIGFTTVLQAGHDNVSGNLGLVLRQQYETGAKYYEIDKKIEYGQWAHILVSYDVTSVNNEPLVMINGEKANTNDIFAGTNPSQGAPKTHIPNESTFKLGHYHEGAAASSLWNSQFGGTKIYSGLMSEAQAIEEYNKQKGTYEKEFDVRFYNKNNLLINKNEMNDLYVDGNSIKINFEEAEKSTVNEDNVFIADITENKWIECNRYWQNDIYVIDNFLLSKNHDYKLVIKDIKDTDVNNIRETEQITEFSVVEGNQQNENGLNLIAQWDMQNYTIVGDTYKINDASGNDIVLNMFNTFDNKVTIGKNEDNTYAENYYMQHQFPSNNAQQYNSEDGTYSDYPEKLFEAFDSKYTFETWFKMDEPVPVLGGIFEVTSDGNIGFTTVLQAGNDNSSGKLGLTLRQQYEVGAKYYEIDKRLDYGKWHHILVSYDVSSVNNEPLVMINGEKAITNDVFTTIDPSSGNPKQHTPNESTFKLGHYHEGATGSALWDSQFSRTKIFSGIVSEEQAKTFYEHELADFEYDFGIKLYNSQNEEIGYEDYIVNSHKSINYFTLNTKNVGDLEGKIYAVNKDSGEKITLSGTMDNDLFTVNFEPLSTGDYTLYLSNDITDINGHKIRNTDYTLDFSYVSDQFKVKSVKLLSYGGGEAVMGKDNIVKAQIVVDNYNEETAPVIIVAGYQDNKLIEVSFVNGFDQIQANTLTTEFIRIDNCDNVRVMLWNSDMKSMMDVKVFSTE